MKVVLQKVKKASVSVDNKIVGEIDKGYCLLVGVHKDSTSKDAKYLAKKIAEARLFEDENDKLNLGLKDVGGSILSVSQFTLYADTKKVKDLALLVQLDQKMQTGYTKNLMNTLEKKVLK